MKFTILFKLSNKTFHFGGLYCNSFAKDHQKIMSKVVVNTQYNVQIMYYRIVYLKPI